MSFYFVPILYELTSLHIFQDIFIHFIDQSF